MSACRVSAGDFVFVGTDTNPTNDPDGTGDTLTVR
jgi:hypothetical protein